MTPVLAPFRDADGAVTYIHGQSRAMVLKANPGFAWAPGQLDAKTAEVAEVLTRRLCLDLIDQGRADLARTIRIAWEKAACDVCGAQDVPVSMTNRFADWTAVMQCTDIAACWDRRADRCVPSGALRSALTGPAARR
jgi:hypothetical protein